ncbi:hypothetical protein ACIRPK_09320 [Kitasatospora sp. NPDC101801]|uniref:hypothetical protein n=1 Tax=Kitasatospora sp. NPDC101801 TaxID=3364103 RepID=UPI00382B0FA0
MRRTAALLTTALLLATGVLAAPAANAQPASVPGPGGGSCFAYPSGPFGIGVCSGIEPRRAWAVHATCESGINVTSGLRLGDGTATANCGSGRIRSTSVAIGPLVP